MDTDPGILCFQHCRPVNVFCFDLPSSCPACAAPMGNAAFSVLPFRVPYPFVRATQYPCCIVIKPTAGDFLHDYFNSKNLHIGVTSSSGIVFEFDKNGLQYGKGNHWNQCLIVEGEAGPFKDHWDSTLNEVTQQDCWTPQRWFINELLIGTRVSCSPAQSYLHRLHVRLGNKECHFFNFRNL